MWGWCASDHCTSHNNDHTGYTIDIVWLLEVIYVPIELVHVDSHGNNFGLKIGDLLKKYGLVIQLIAINIEFFEHMVVEIGEI